MKKKWDSSKFWTKNQDCPSKSRTVGEYVSICDELHHYFFLFTVQIESSGPTYRGFAIQARESTPSFSSAAPFVGEFVNAPAVGDWQIWNCGAVSIPFNINSIGV